MREQIQARIEALKRELETGQAALENVERQRAYLRETTLRITGTIQVLEELLGVGQLAWQNEASPNLTQTGLAQDPEANVHQTKM
jgi:hypothetical protein